MQRPVNARFWQSDPPNAKKRSVHVKCYDTGWTEGGRESKGMSGQLLLATGRSKQSPMWHSLTHLASTAKQAEQAASVSLARHSQTKLRHFVAAHSLKSLRQDAARHVRGVRNSAEVDSVGGGERL